MYYVPDFSSAHLAYQVHKSGRKTPISKPDSSLAMLPWLLYNSFVWGP